MSDIIERVKTLWQTLYASLTIDMLLYIALALLLLWIVTACVAASRRRTIARLLEKTSAPVEAPTVHTVPVPAPVSIREAPDTDADRVLALAKQLCENADAAYEQACRELDEQAQRTRAFYRKQQDKAYEALKGAREMRQTTRESKPKTKEPGKDPYNLGSLDDLDEE